MAEPTCPPWCVKTTHAEDAEDLPVIHYSRNFMSGKVSVFVATSAPVYPTPTIFVSASGTADNLLLNNRSKADGLAVILDAVGAREAAAAVREAAELLPEEDR